MLSLPLEINFQIDTMETMKVQIAGEWVGHWWCTNVWLSVVVGTDMARNGCIKFHSFIHFNRTAVCSAINSLSNSTASLIEISCDLCLFIDPAALWFVMVRPKYSALYTLHATRRTYLLLFAVTMRWETMDIGHDMIGAIQLVSNWYDCIDCVFGYYYVIYPNEQWRKRV